MGKRVPDERRMASVVRAIAIVERSRQTHVLWRDYYSSFSDTERVRQESECKFAGSLENHLAFIEGYDEVLAVLHEFAGLTEAALNAARAEIVPITYSK